MSHYDDSFNIQSGTNKGFIIKIVFFVGIFIFVIYPLYLRTLRYQTAHYLIIILTIFGGLVQTAGTILFILGIFTLFTHNSSRAIGMLIIGFFLIALGFWISSGFGSIQYPIGSSSTEDVPSGWH